MSGVQNYSGTAGSNTDSNFFPENQLPSTVNNAARQLQADLSDFYRDDGWRELGDGTGSGDGTSSYTATFSSSTQVTFSDIDTTAIYQKGRRVKAMVDGGSPFYGIVTASSFTTDTTVDFAWDSTALSSGTIRLWVGEDPTDEPNQAVAAVKEVLQTPSISSNTLAIDVKLGTYVQTTLDANITTISVTWPSGVSSFTLQLTQDGTGSRTVAWPAGWKWSNGVEPTQTADAGAVDLYVIHSPDGGTTVFAARVGEALA